MADLPYARVRTWHNLHLINNTRPVRLLRKVHGQVTSIGIDGLKIEETDVKKTLNVRYHKGRTLYHDACFSLL